MKIGFIVECVDEGPETKVIPTLARLVNPDITCDIEPLGSKPKVLSDCGKSAKALLEKSDCARVVVLWDARPAWEEGTVTFSIEEEYGKAKASLKAAGLDSDNRVKLICIVEELEAWLLADGRGVTARIKHYLKNHPLKKSVQDFKYVEKITWPKSVMERIFKTNRVTAYEDWKDAGAIAAGIPNTNRLLKHSAVFPDFAAAVS